MNDKVIDGVKATVQLNTNAQINVFRTLRGPIGQ